MKRKIARGQAGIFRITAKLLPETGFTETKCSVFTSLYLNDFSRSDKRLAANLQGKGGVA